MLVSERELGRHDGLAQVERIVERAAPNAVHLRARLTARRRYEISERLAHVADRAQGWLVVNGRPDIALAAGARAVQLGRTALGVGETRALVEASGGRLFIGASLFHPCKQGNGRSMRGSDPLWTCVTKTSTRNLGLTVYG